MGTYLNPGKQLFLMALRSKIYVDKTDMIQYLNSVINTNQRYVCVSRPRRFGKTMAADMLCAYYDIKADSRDLFADKKLAHCAPVTVADEKIPWDMEMNRYDVLRIVMTDFMGDVDGAGDMLDNLVEELASELTEAYPEINYGKRLNLRTMMSKIASKTGRQFVVVIDEWDAVFRKHKDDIEGQTKYLDFLRVWLKDKDYIALVYMTGILPIKKYGEHSALNMFTEYSMMAPMQLARFTGFTNDEVRKLCNLYGMDYDSVSNWYDGYLVVDRIPEDKRKAYREGRYTAHRISLYSPLSVVNAVTTGYIRNYWNKTETYEALAEYIRRNYDGLKEAVALMMDGGRLRIDTSSYQNDMTTFHGCDDVLSLLVHLGYLGYDADREEVFIPNKEILDEFKISTKTDEWVDTFRAFEESLKLVKATWNCEEQKVAQMLEDAHNRAGNATYNNEAALSYSIRLAYYAAQKYYTVIPEFDSGKGYADVVYLPNSQYADKPVLLVELKYKKDVDTALSQIKKQKYPDRLEHYKGNILLIGINYEKDNPNYSPDFKHHTCSIEKA